MVSLEWYGFMHRAHMEQPGSGIRNQASRKTKHSCHQFRPALSSGLSQDYMERKFTDWLRQWPGQAQNGEYKRTPRAPRCNPDLRCFAVYSHVLVRLELASSETACI